MILTSSLDKFVTQKHESRLPKPTKKIGILEEWLENNFRNEGTKKGYRLSCFYFLQSVYGEKEYSKITQTAEGIDRYFKEHERNFLDDVKKMVRFMDSKGYAPKTVNHHTHNIGTFFEEHGHEVSKKEWKQMRRLLPTNVPITQDKILTKELFRTILGYLGINGKAIALFLLSSGARIGETIQLKIENLDLDADPPEATFRATTTKKGLGGRTVFMSYEARDAIREWLVVKDSRRKPGGYGEFPKEMVFGVSDVNFRKMWHLALKKARLDIQDSETRYYLYHIHTLRKFFETNMSLAGVPKDIYEAWMGHTGYLGGAYKRYTKEELAKVYKQHMDVVSIYGSVPSEFKQKLEAIEQEVKAKDEELAKVNEMLDKLGIPNDRPLEERLLEYFKLTQTKATPQPIKSEVVTPTTQTTQKSVYDPKEHAKLEGDMAKLGYVRVGKESPILPTKEYFTCRLDGKAYEIMKLPCIDDPLFRCANKLCEKQVMALLK